MPLPSPAAAGSATAEAIKGSYFERRTKFAKIEQPRRSGNHREEKRSVPNAIVEAAARKSVFVFQFAGLVVTVGDRPLTASTIDFESRKGKGRWKPPPKTTKQML